VKPFDQGTIEVAKATAELTKAGKLVSVAGGGDTVAALNRAIVAERFTYVSTLALREAGKSWATR